VSYRPHRPRLTAAFLAFFGSPACRALSSNPMQAQAAPRCPESAFSITCAWSLAVSNSRLFIIIGRHDWATCKQSSLLRDCCADTITDRRPVDCFDRPRVGRHRLWLVCFNLGSKLEQSRCRDHAAARRALCEKFVHPAAALDMPLLPRGAGKCLGELVETSPTKACHQSRGIIAAHGDLSAKSKLDDLRRGGSKIHAKPLSGSEIAVLASFQISQETS
jgi:hypothetical protein